MGSCVSVHKNSQESAMKVGLSFDSKTDNLIIQPLPVMEISDAVNGDFALKSQSLSPFNDLGSKDETFFDSRAYMDSDCDDDFLSVNGDFTPSRGNTPVHNNSFSVGTPKTYKATEDGYPGSTSETSPGKKMKLVELFRANIKENEDGTPCVSRANSRCSSERTANGDNLMFKEKPLRSAQRCLPSLVSCRSFNERKKKTSPAINVNCKP